MIHCSSSVDRDVGSDSEQLEETQAELLNEVNAEGDRTGAFKATSGGSPFMSGEKSITTIIKPTTKETK